MKPLLFWIALTVVLATACAPGSDVDAGGAGQGAGHADGNGNGNGTTGNGFANGSGSGSSCALACTTDLHAVIDCNNTVVTQCTGDQACDLSSGTCTNACASAETNHLSVGCDYYATDMDQIFQDVCFAAFVANTWNTPVHINAEFGGTPLSLAQIARIPSGSGPSLVYNAYDEAAGLPPGQVAILFLAGGLGVACPPGVQTGVPSGAMSQVTGIGTAFHITTDVPVVTYQINPFGGGSAATTAASLLLPTSVWDTNYIAVNVTPFDIANPSLNVVAKEDGTTVTILPKADVQAGTGVPFIAAGTPGTVMLNHGEHLQISQQAELTGSVIQSDKPVGFMAGQDCMRVPVGAPYCDHGEQMIPPIKALGSEYVGVMYRARVPTETSTIWKIVGAVEGTQLTWTPDVGGPTTLGQGQDVEFTTGTPFVVKSQDADHPFILMTYMQSNGAVADGYGDPDLVVSVPPPQYLNRYVFFADPTYPETNLVIVRAKNADGSFSNVNLDCAGDLTGWQAVGDYEWTRIDLSTGDFVPSGACNTGAHEMKSDGRFGLWVWGWGTPRDLVYQHARRLLWLPRRHERAADQPGRHPARPAVKSKRSSARGRLACAEEVRSAR